MVGVPRKQNVHRVRAARAQPAGPYAGLPRGSPPGAFHQVGARAGWGSLPHVIGRVPLDVCARGCKCKLQLAVNPRLVVRSVFFH